MATLSTIEFENFREYIQTECGISLGVDKIYLVESRLKGLLSTHQITSYGELYQLAIGPKKPVLRQQIIDAITTNETLWFRDKTPFTVLQEVLLPRLKQMIIAGKPRVRIWSAACSTGQEPYSIAMVINDFIQNQGEGKLNHYHFEIVATDISTQALAIARLGAYDQFSMGRGMDDGMIDRYFKQNQQFWIVDGELKKMIKFQEFNLQDDYSSLGAFDIVFLRNVAIYFSNDMKVKVFSKIHQMLPPHGVLFLGSTESLAYYSTSFRSMEHGKAVYYVPGTAPLTSPQPALQPA